MLEDGLQTAAVGDLQGVLPQTDDVSQYTKKQDADSHNDDVMVTDVCRCSGFQGNQFSQL